MYSVLQVSFRDFRGDELSEKSAWNPPTKVWKNDLLHENCLFKNPMLSFQACPSLTAGTNIAEEKGLSMSKLLLIEQTKNGDVRPFRTRSLA